MMLSITQAVQFAGIIQVGIFVIALLAPRILRFQENLAALSAPIRRLVWVYSGFIALVIGGMAALSMFHDEALTDGSPLARSICAFAALFWLARLLVQLTVLDGKTLAPEGILRWGYRALTICFVYLVGAYSAAMIVA